MVVYLFVDVRTSTATAQFDVVNDLIPQVTIRLAPSTEFINMLIDGKSVAVVAAVQPLRIISSSSIGSLSNNESASFSYDWMEVEQGLELGPVR